MKCSKAQKLINDHVNNLLDANLVQVLESHLESCASCRDLFLDMEAIINNAGELDNPDPSEDLWPVIKRQVLKKSREVQMHEKSFFGNFTLYSRGPAFALSTLLVIMLLIPILYYSLPHLRNTGIHIDQPALSGFQIAEQQYQSAIEALDRAIGKQYEKLDPELMAVFNKNLAIIDESIRICKESIDNSAKAQETDKLLLICYRKKIELLNEIKEIAMQS